MFPIRNDQAAENPSGIILMVAITVVLAVMVMLMAMQLLPDLGYDPTVPDVFQITKVGHTDASGTLDYDSYLMVMNTGDVTYDNRKLSAKTYRNGDRLTDIPYINENLFIHHHPTGISHTGGVGTDDFSWYPGAGIFVYYDKRTFHPGDVMQFEVYDRTTGQLISRDTYQDKNEIQERCMRMYFNHQGA